MNRLPLVLLLLAVAGCRPAEVLPDGGEDAGVVVVMDAGNPGMDSGTEVDAGSDAGLEADAGLPGDGGLDDGGAPGDGGTTDGGATDGGTTDGGTTDGGSGDAGIDAGVRITPGADVIGATGRAKSATYTFDVELGNPVGQQPARSATYTLQGNTPIKP